MFSNKSSLALACTFFRNFWGTTRGIFTSPMFCWIQSTFDICWCIQHLPTTASPPTWRSSAARPSSLWTQDQAHQVSRKSPWIYARVESDIGFYNSLHRSIKVISRKQMLNTQFVYSMLLKLLIDGWFSSSFLFLGGSGCCVPNIASYRLVGHPNLWFLYFSFFLSCKSRSGWINWLITRLIINR